MPAKFRRGQIVYAKDGRSYSVEDTEDGMVYCSAPNGTETEFPESQLRGETERVAATGLKRENLYARLKQAPAYTAAIPKLDAAACAKALDRIERLSPGLLDFTAHSVAARALTEAGDAGFIDGLTPVKCREIFDAAKPESRIGLLAGLLGSKPEVLLSAAQLGDNLVRAMIDKGLAATGGAFEAFGNRRRR